MCAKALSEKLIIIKNPHILLLQILLKPLILLICYAYNNYIGVNVLSVWEEYLLLWL